MTKLTSCPASLQLVAELRKQGITNTKVLNAIAVTPRDLFIEEAFQYNAWQNSALPIGSGQTISKPYIVAKMTEALLAYQPKKVLEIGSGSGYQAAILAQLVQQVCSVERIKHLQRQARRRLQQLELYNIAMKHGDGWHGWLTKAPFDAIIVTAAPNQVPKALLTQLTNGGCLVIPVGNQRQVLQVIYKRQNGFISETLEPVRFVPLISGELA